MYFHETDFYPLSMLECTSDAELKISIWKWSFLAEIWDDFNKYNHLLQ